MDIPEIKVMTKKGEVEILSVYEHEGVVYVDIGEDWDSEELEAMLGE